MISKARHHRQPAYGAECPFIANDTRATGDPEPVDSSETSGEHVGGDEPPEPVDIDRQSR